MTINVNTVSSEYEFIVKTASYIGKPIDNSVLYITKKIESQIKNLERARHCLVFADDTIDVPEAYKVDNCIIETKTPALLYANFVCKLAEAIEVRNRLRRYRLTDGGYYVGESVSIGRNPLIEPLAFLDHDVVIGDNAIIRSGAKIRNSIIGDNFLANENCAIGTNGFTMTSDEYGNIIRIPTLGKVIIGDNVEIGVCDNISAGSGGNTIICNNVKIDALVHVGHDAHLKENVQIIAGGIIGGFDILGQNLYVGINASLRNRIVIGDNAVIGMGTVVVKNVASNKTVIGNPAKELIK